MPFQRRAIRPYDSFSHRDYVVGPVFIPGVRTLTGTAGRNRKRGKTEDDRRRSVRGNARRRRCSRSACRCLGNTASRIQAQPPLSAIFDTTRKMCLLPLSLSFSTPRVFVFSRTMSMSAMMFISRPRGKPNPSRVQVYWIAVSLF